MQIFTCFNNPYMAKYSILGYPQYILLQMHVQPFCIACKPGTTKNIVTITITE